MSSKNFKSDAFAAIHASTIALRRVDAIDKATMRDLDASCLPMPTTFTPADIPADFLGPEERRTPPHDHDPFAETDEACAVALGAEFSKLSL